MNILNSKILISLVLIFTTISTNYAQRENDTWVFGNNKWIFDSNQTNGFIHSSIGSYPFKYGTASVSDKNTGELLFYSDGTSIIDKNGNLMQNGGYLFGDPAPNTALERFYLTSGLCGGNKTQQPVIILPKPGSTERYYVFSSVYTDYRYYCTDGYPREFFNFGIRYAEVDMSNGLGNVVSKNNLVQANGSNGLSSTLHGDGNSIWLVTTNNGDFYSYKIDSGGVSTTPIINSFAQDVFNTIKISPNGEYLFNNTLNYNASKNNYALYNFNKTNGQVTNRTPILPSSNSYDSFVDATVGPSSFEFSPDSNILYFISAEACLCTSHPFELGKLSMYNISTGELAGGTYPLFEFGYTSANLQRAINGKIYLIFNSQGFDPNFNYDVEFGYWFNGNTYSYDWGVIEYPDNWNPNINPISYISPPLNVKNGYMFPQLIPEIPNCTNDLIITQNVFPGATDIQSALNTVTATNIIFNQGTAKYDAGVSVFLKPGFNAKSGSEFRAFIQGCTVPPLPKIEDGLTQSDEGLNLKTEKILILYPNPTSGLLHLSSEEKMYSWEISNPFGTIQDSGSFRFLNDAKNLEINLNNFITGVYYVKVVFQDGEIITKKIIRE